MPCPDCDQLYAELAALKAALEAACTAIAEQQGRLLDQLERAFERRHKIIVALVDRHLADSVARLEAIEAAMRFPRGTPPSEPPSRH
jgi:hypothetical protein